MRENVGNQAGDKSSLLFLFSVKCMAVLKHEIFFCAFECVLATEISEQE